MNTLLVVSVACLLAFSAVTAKTYSAEFDKLDVDALLNDSEKVNMFAGCLLDDAICTEKALILKGVLVDALQTKCGKCTETQKSHIRKAAKFFIKNLPEQWEKMVDKYDPEGKHAAGFTQFLLAV